jgi:hypothetical protein
MNAWDIDPNLYASLWRLLREWYLNRKSLKSAPSPVKRGRQAGCRA